MIKNILETRRNSWTCIIILVVGLLWSGQVFSQPGNTINGVILESQSQEALPGVAVLEKGTNNGTVTDLDGRYALTLKTENASLVVSYIGFATQEIIIGGQSQIDFSLSEETQALEEVVIVGYGSQKKSDLTGAIASVDSRSMTERNFTNPVEALQGNVPGVQIGQSSGRLGDALDISIRGKSTISDNTQPLFVVDGVPTDGIDFLNPQDIAQIDVLKDASSTAIYGSRGTNGVVIVTTKSGTSAKSGVNVSFDTFFGVKEVARLPEMMDAQTWWYYHQSAYLATAAERDGNNGRPEDGNNFIDEEELFLAVTGRGFDASRVRNQVLLDRAAANQSFDWYDAVLKSGVQQNSYLSVNGRSGDGLSYNLGVGYQNETGNIENEELSKYTFKAGVNHYLSTKFSTGINLTITRSEIERGSEIAMQEAFRLNLLNSPWEIDDDGNELVGQLWRQPGKLPYPSLNDPDNLALDKTSTWNPLLEIANASDFTVRDNLIGSVFLQYEVFDWLSLKTTYSAGLDNSTRGRSWGRLTNTGNNNGPTSEVNERQNYNYSWDNQFNINYALGDHDFKFLGLQSLFLTETFTSFISSRQQPFETGINNIGFGPQSTFNLGSNYEKTTLSSWAARLNYSYLGKYLITLSNRWDGTSLFTEENRWASFFSSAIAWRIKEESFLSGVDVLSNLKLRASYGFTGNNIVDPYSTVNNLNTQTFYDFGGTVVSGFVPSNLANPRLTWERTQEWNVGLDFGVLNDRITGSLDVYNRLSEDLLQEQELPLEAGFEFVNSNLASVSNKGVEIMLNTRVIDNNTVSWDVNFTYTNNTNIVESIYGQSEIDDPGNNLFIGESIDAFYNFKFNGIWQADEADEAVSYNQSEGQAKVVDFNDDGAINPNDDRVILGSSDPDWSGSLFTRLRVNRFDLSASIITNQGVLAYSRFHENFTNTRDRGRQKLNIVWYVPENQAGLPAQVSNEYPQARNMGTYWRDNGVGYYRDASFVKVKNISLGYSFGQEATNKLGIQSLRVYGNVLNPFVFSDYDGWDPEWANAGFGVGRVSSITYQLGLNVKF